MCAHGSLTAEEERKGLQDRTQTMLELGEYGSVSNNQENVDGENEGNQNMTENDPRRVGVVVGALADAVVFPHPRSQLKESDNDLDVGADASHESPHGPGQRSESSTRRAVLGGSLDMVQMGRCVLQSGPSLLDG